MKIAVWAQQNVGKAILITFATYVGGLAAVHYIPMPWLTGARGFAMAKLGPFGDSFGMLTAIFAAVAALGAWRSYDAQRLQLQKQQQQLDDEKNRHRGTRFDETFFRLVEHYDKELDDLLVTVPRSFSTFANPQEHKKVEAIAAFKRSVKMFQFDDQRLGKDTDALAWAFKHKFFKPLVLLRDQEIAITRWLKRQSKNVIVEIRGALLVAKLSDEELWFWYYSIFSTGDEELIEFARKLGIDRKRAQDAERKADDGVELDTEP